MQNGVDIWWPEPGDEANYCIIITYAGGASKRETFKSPSGKDIH